jgi:hypothetical protein
MDHWGSLVKPQLIMKMLQAFNDASLVVIVF